jgi:hypothetical protein
MGIDYYSCVVCGEAFPDVIDYGHCGKCEETLCGDCRDKMGEKYGVIGEEHEKASWYGEDAPNCCDECNKPTIDNKKFETLMYFLIKDVAKYNFYEFLEEIGLTDDDYEHIKNYLSETYGIKMYL